jgi:hypothetical protein
MIKPRTFKAEPCAAWYHRQKEKRTAGALSLFELEAGSWKLEAGSWKLETGSWKLILRPPQ